MIVWSHAHGIGMILVLYIISEILFLCGKTRRPSERAREKAEGKRLEVLSRRKRKVKGGNFVVKP